MLEDAVLRTIADGLQDVFDGSQIAAVTVTIGEPAVPMTANDPGVRIVLEDGGSPTSDRIDGGFVYRAEVEVMLESYQADPAPIRQAREIVTSYFTRLFIRSVERHSSRWDSTGWSVRDEGRHRVAIGDFSARIYSAQRLQERIHA